MDAYSANLLELQKIKKKKKKKRYQSRSSKIARLCFVNTNAF